VCCDCGSTCHTFPFGQPFFMEPTIDASFLAHGYSRHLSLMSASTPGKCGEWIHSRNTQIFRGFFTGKYIFNGPVGFLHYASPASLGNGFGPSTHECASADFSTIAYVTPPTPCPTGTSFDGGPLLLYLQHGAATTGETNDQSGASDIANEDFSVFVQDSWKLRRNFTSIMVFDGKRSIFQSVHTTVQEPLIVLLLAIPRFPSNGTLPNQNKEIPAPGRICLGHPRQRQVRSPRELGHFLCAAEHAYRSGSYHYERRTAAVSRSRFGLWFAANLSECTALTLSPPGTVPSGGGVTVFAKDYANPRVYTTNVGYEQELFNSWSGYIDLTISKAVHLTHFVDPNVCCSSADLILSPNSDVNSGGPSYKGAKPFPTLGITDTTSTAKSLYRVPLSGSGSASASACNWMLIMSIPRTWTLTPTSVTPSVSAISTSTIPIATISYSDRDEKHKFNLITHAELPGGFLTDIRVQAHTAQPASALGSGTPSGPACSATNSQHRLLSGPGGTIIDCGRNHLRKDNGYFTF